MKIDELVNENMSLIKTIEKQNRLIVSQQQEIEMYKRMNSSIHKEYQKKARIVFDEVLSYIGKR